MRIVINSPFMGQVIVGSYSCIAPSFTNMGSSHRDSHISDHSTHTGSYATFCPTIGQCDSSQLSMEHNIQYTQSDTNRHIDYHGHSSACVPLPRQDSLL